MGAWDCRDRQEQPPSGSAFRFSNAGEEWLSFEAERQPSIDDEAGSPRWFATRAAPKAGDEHGSNPPAADNDAPIIAARASVRHRGP